MDGLSFFQAAPRLENTFSDDTLIRSVLRRCLGDDVYREIEPGLTALGRRAATDLAQLARQAEAHPPRHVPFDPWGQRIDEIEVSPAWGALHRAAAEEGIVATAYAREHGSRSRVHQMARLYLYHPSSALYSCPLAMTDGAARTLELYGGEAQRETLERLTTTDPERFWTSGQWMTERTGGSDVGATTTVAREVDGQWLLTGDKWFTSATTSDVALTLARPEGAGPGSKGLSMFLVRLRDAEGKLQNISINRLKDKLGTKALPTAELSLRDTPATMIGEPGNGIRRIASLLNITRTYNAVCCIGGMSRGLMLARDYARRRSAFGRPLTEHPLHLRTLADLQIEFEGAVLLTFRVAQLLGRDECGEASEQEQSLLRLMTPLAKLYTAKQAVAVTSEVLECFGGAGYVEDTGLPVLLRDAQVTPIWEGTTNILSLDVLRALSREEAFGPWLTEIERCLANAPEALAGAVAAVSAARDTLAKHAMGLAQLDPPSVQLGARAFAFGMARTTMAALAVAHAGWAAREAEARDAALRMAAAKAFCRTRLVDLVDLDGDPHEEAALLAMG